MELTLFLGVVVFLPFVVKVYAADCSCYTFHEDGLTWTAARQSCKSNGGDLVSMETPHEWQVVRDYIQNLTNKFNNDWHIGLRRNTTVIGNWTWTWVNGKPLTINHWQPWQPRDGAPYVVMAKNYPPGTRGLFNDIRGDIFAGFICEIPSECSRSGLTCKITEVFRAVPSGTSSKQTPPTLRTEKNTRASNTDIISMVRKVQPPAGFIHWTIAIIPLVCVILVLVCVIGFLLWRLKMKTSKQNGDITAQPFYYDAQTRSLRKQDDGANNFREVNQLKVHFQDSPDCEDQKYHLLQRSANNENRNVQYASPYKTPGQLSISRRLAIRRKSSDELKGKYPLNKGRENREVTKDYSALKTDSTEQNNESDNCRAYQALVTDYEEPVNIILAGKENAESHKCSEDELSYLEIIA
ncbi:layilin [Pocillopora verrucosa]|uniref:layilin n=1 Tax=Pocillopora verrucosa TaxID=203993 RepID=UPI0033414DB7